MRFWFSRTEKPTVPESFPESIRESVTPPIRWLKNFSKSSVFSFEQEGILQSSWREAMRPVANMVGDEVLWIEAPSVPSCSFEDLMPQVAKLLNSRSREKLGQDVIGDAELKKFSEILKESCQSKTPSQEELRLRWIRDWRSRLSDHEEKDLITLLTQVNKVWIEIYGQLGWCEGYVYGATLEETKALEYNEQNKLILLCAEIIKLYGSYTH